VSSETRHKLRVANLGKKRPDHVIEKIVAGLKGRQVNAETRKKISNSLTGHAVSQSTREKLRLANLGKKQSKDSIRKMVATRIGVPRSEETKAKISAKKKGNVVITFEQRKKLSEAAKAQWARLKGKQNAQESK
jgi:hypothetical protein